MTKLYNKCKDWWTEHYQGFTLSWPPGINLNKDKHTLKYFTKLLEKNEWVEEFIEKKEIWVSQRDTTFQIHIGEQQSEFEEEWTTKHPSKDAYQYPVYLKIGDSIIKELTFIYLDGFRIFVPLPEVTVKSGKRQFSWDMNKLELKVCKIIGKYYIHENIENVADMSGIEIKT